MNHKWRLVIVKGNDAPNESLDSVYWCDQCGTVKHDYAHGGGMKSPNYPVYYVPGLDAQPEDQCCEPSRIVELIAILNAAKAERALLSGALYQAVEMLTARLDLADITDEEKAHRLVMLEILGKRKDEPK